MIIYVYWGDEHSFTSYFKGSHPGPRVLTQSQLGDFNSSKFPAGSAIRRHSPNIRVLKKSKVCAPAQSIFGVAQQGSLVVEGALQTSRLDWTTNSPKFEEAAKTFGPCKIWDGLLLKDASNFIWGTSSASADSWAPGLL